MKRAWFVARVDSFAGHLVKLSKPMGTGCAAWHQASRFSPTAADDFRLLDLRESECEEAVRLTRAHDKS